MSKLNPRVDFVFKKLFGAIENKELLIDLINSIVDEKDRVKDIEIRNPYNEKNFLDDKMSILDIKAQDSLTGSWFLIEMQISKQDSYDKRALYYWARTYINQISSGINYDALTKTISINFLNFNMVPEENYHNVYKLINRSTGKEFIDQLEIHFIELEKFKEYKEAKTLLDKWTYFLKEAGAFDKIPKILEEVGTIKRALELLENINMTADERETYEARLKWLRDEESALTTAKEEGIEIGKEIGKEEGKLEAKKIIAKGLIGIIDDELIAEKTGLSIEIIKSLK